MSDPVNQFSFETGLSCGGVVLRISAWQFLTQLRFYPRALVVFAFLILQGSVAMITFKEMSSIKNASLSQRGN